MYCTHWTRYYVIHSKFIIFGDNFALTYLNFPKLSKQLSRICRRGSRGGGRAGLGPPPPPPAKKKKKKKKREREGKEGKGKRERKGKKEEEEEKKRGKKEIEGPCLSGCYLSPPPPPPNQKIKEKEGKENKNRKIGDKGKEKRGRRKEKKGDISCNFPANKLWIGGGGGAGGGGGNKIQTWFISNSITVVLQIMLKWHNFQRFFLTFK